MGRSLTLVLQWGGLALTVSSGVVLCLILAFTPDQSSVAFRLYLPLTALGLGLAVIGFRWERFYRRAEADSEPAPPARSPARTVSSLKTVSMAASNSGAAEVVAPVEDEPLSTPPVTPVGDAPERPSFTVDLDLATAQTDRFAIDDKKPV